MNRKKTRTSNVDKAMEAIPDRFHEELRRWFAQRYPAPTDIQIRSWPIIAEGKHTLITAPTGSGKTLTAFLWAINQLLSKSWPSGATQALYISPLKALNNDIRRNLIEPLNELKLHFESKGLPFPDIRVQTRSGDTPSSERQRMVRKPPEILITTPESLNLLITSKNASHTLNQVKTVILDEIHALVESKRGVYLMSAIERLALSAGEFQRIALSATVNPLERVAQFIGGYEIRGPLDSPSYVERPVEIISSKTRKVYDLTSCFPDEAVEAPPEETVWIPVAKECKRRIAKNRSTLIFANNRALCEKITLLINAGEPELIAYAHHGSLSREIRLDVEQRLKKGQFKAIVATNSLELGIDIGDLDEVLLVQCPGSVASTLQRLGRAGHRIGQVSHGCLITTHPRDFLEAAAMLEAVDERAIEASELIQAPLDILPQIIVSMIATSSWTRSQLFNALKACFAYQKLSESHFDLVLNMMLGKFTDTRIHELRPLIGIDSTSHHLTLRQGTIQRYYLNSGVIPNRGYYHLRHSDSQARIGELDEEYVWEASVGQTLTLGTQHWKIDRITHNDVFVSAANPKAPGIPFWRADDLNRSFHFSEKIGQYLEWANAITDKKHFETLLSKNSQIDPNTSQALAQHLKAQKLHTEVDLPHRHHLLVEITSTGPGSSPGNQVIIHTLWGGKVNRPYAIALLAAWNKRFDKPIEIHPSNDCIAIVLPHDIDTETLLELVTPQNAETLLRDHLESSGFFAARFRECAGRALLITKRKFNERLPLWMSRLRSQKLFEAVSKYEDFPITLETWRTCLLDEFDLPNLIARLAELESGEITWSQARTHQPSPMARSVAWRQVNDYMYRPDAPGSPKRSASINQTLVQELLSNESLRPQIPTEIIHEFEQKRQRLAKGYTPDSANELSEWLKERIVIKDVEWQSLIEGMARDHGLGPNDLYQPIRKQLRRRLDRNRKASLVFHETLWTKLRSTIWTNLDLQIQALDDQLEWVDLEGENHRSPNEKNDDTAIDSLILDWVQFTGPSRVEELAQHLGIDPIQLKATLDALTGEKQLIAGHLENESNDLQYCDPGNLEILLRMKRRAASPRFEALPGLRLQGFLAQFQGIAALATKPRDSISDHLNQLLFYPAACQLWESEILPARWCNYSTRQFDLELHESEIIWLGTSKQEVQFAYTDELHLASFPQRDREEVDREKLLPDPGKKYEFGELLELHEMAPSEVSNQLWKEAWNGTVSNDRFATLRHAISNHFKVPSLLTDTTPKRRRIMSRPTRSMLSKWKGAQPSQGHWFQLPELEEIEEGIESEEIKKDRVRLLLDRYGILFRELLWKETPPFSWKTLFRTLRIMEFSGEVISGYFFQDIPGPQFTTQKTLRQLQSGDACDRPYWINATDPISLCGIGVPKLRPAFPKRLTSNHLVFCGPELILISERIGKKLKINLPPEHHLLPLAFGFLTHLLSRSFQPIPRITIETINEKPAPSSPYVEILRSQFELIAEPGRLSLYRSVPG